MTTDKLPDVVLLRFADNGNIRMWRPTAFPHGTAFVRKSTLDAMTAERDALREGVKAHQWECQTLKQERDSAREALAKATELLRECADRLRICSIAGDSDPEYADAAVSKYRAFLAAQPETKP